jgi:hypothetical protein
MPGDFSSCPSTGQDWEKAAGGKQFEVASVCENKLGGQSNSNFMLDGGGNMYFVMTQDDKSGFSQETLIEVSTTTIVNEPPLVLRDLVVQPSIVTRVLRATLIHRGTTRLLVQPSER